MKQPKPKRAVRQSAAPRAKGIAKSKPENEVKTAALTAYRQLMAISWLRVPVVWFIFPLLVYTVLFYFFSPHYLGQFSNLFFLDSGDGFQNVWNVWWVNHSLGEQAANPYFTTAIHWPHGTSLIPQTMNIYNGLVAIPLMQIFGFSLVETVNVAVLSGFIVGGITMFWFVQKLLGKYWVSLIAGGLFTFSSYHFAHGLGHLQLVSLQWIPLFLLAFWLLIEKMRYRYALFAASALFLVLLCDYYYLFWSVIVGGMWVGWKLYKKELQITKQSLKVFGVFVAACLALIGPLAYKLVHLNKVDPLLGSHDPAVFGLDPLSVVLPGGMSQWAALTDWHWPYLPYASETSMFFGYALIVVVLIAFYRKVVKRQESHSPSWLWFWWIVLAVFGVLALGPHPTMFGMIVESIPLPYLLLEKIFPTLQLSGMPIRWVLIALIAAIVIVSYMLSKLDMTKRSGQILLAIFVAFSIIELYPKDLPLTPAEVPKYVHVLKDLPDGAVIDNAALSSGWQLRDQTVHEKPMAFGYVTRLPESVDRKDFEIFADLEEGRYNELCTQHNIRYVTLPPSRPLAASPYYSIVYQDKEAVIYDLGKAGDC